MHSLTIVIPALDEEEAIGDTIARCLNARAMIQKSAGLEDVEIIVVSDGSTDRTVEIAEGFKDIKVIVFETNRGYGAAIKEGWRRGKGTLLSFLDADGTCDPRFFSKLCNAVIQQKTDVALGSRMGPDSKMPFTRRIGNKVFSVLLGFLCGRSVTDTASGMRVVRRTALKSLYPLPDGLHFTPSMSARALLNGIRVVEIPMTYEERVGNSKLNVLWDGLRFLHTILEGVLCYRPERLFLIGFMFCLLTSLFLAAFPTEFYLRNGQLEEWMIYRFLAGFLLGAAGFTLLCAGTLAHYMAMLAPQHRNPPTFWPMILGGLFHGMGLALFVCVTVFSALALVFSGLVEFATTGHLTTHWSRIMIAAFALLVAFQAMVTGVLLKVLRIWQQQGTPHNQEVVPNSAQMEDKEAEIVSV